jgi:hypothetical protein
MHFASLEHNGFGARLVMPAVDLADEDPQQYGITAEMRIRNLLPDWALRPPARRP